MSQRVLRPISVLAVLAVAVVACSKSTTAPGGGGGGGGGATGLTVTGVGSSVCSGYGSGTCLYYFTPTPDTVGAAGDTVKFVFQDVTHDVHFDTQGSPVDSLGVETNTTVPVVFPTAGTYNYHCTIHPYMTGTIVVQ